jgi:hypothetical protein
MTLRASKTVCKTELHGFRVPSIPHYNIRPYALETHKAMRLVADFRTTKVWGRILWREYLGMERGRA